MNNLDAYQSIVNSFYFAFYGRPADPAGLKFWVEQLANSDGDHRAIIDAFATSREAQVRFGDDTPAERIAEIYQQLFNRTPEQSGVDYWADVVAQGQASLADVAIEILKGAQGTDKGLLDLRQQAVDAFTTLVETSGSDYAGYSSIEAARVLVRAVTPDASQADIAQLVKATVAFADIATNNPAVIDAIATGSSLLALFDSARGKADPVTLAQALADVAAAAAGSPATLESLLRGGGMAQVLKVMPASATLQDVVEALARGGLPAAIDVVYPSNPTPTPTPPKGVTFTFEGVTHDPDDRAPDDHVTNETTVDIRFSVSGALQPGQKIQYRHKGSTEWTDIAPVDGVIVLEDVDLTMGEPVGEYRAGAREPMPDHLLTVELRVADANGGTVGTSYQQEILLDVTDPRGELAFVRIGQGDDGVLKTDDEIVDVTFSIDDTSDGFVQWRIKGSDTWVDAPQANSNGHFTLQGIDLSEADQTIELRVIDAAGNVGFEDSVVIDGPIGISVEMTPQGLRVTSSTAGTIEIGGVPVESTHETTQAIVGTVLVSQQELARSGILTVRTADGQVLQDPSGRVYHLGDADADGPQGSYLWGFQGYDHLEGTAGDDYISGGADNDTIYSMGGSDVISGGAESDTIYLGVDGKGSTLVYEAGDTRSTVVVSGDYFNGMDFIFGAEAGDVIQVGDILHGASTVGDTLLTSAAAGQVSVVRSSGDSRFNVNPDGTSFLVQWTDGTAINSIYFKDYAGHALDLTIDAGRGTLTLVDGPVASTYKSITYSFSATDSGFYLDGMPDGMVHSGVGNGLLAGQDFWLENALTSTQADSDYTSGPGFGIGIDGNMHFGRALEAGVYNMSFNKDTFATDSGYLEAGDIMFAGGVAGNIVQDGFSVPTFLPINYTLNDAGSNVSKMYGAYGIAVQLTTGTQQDVILAGGGVQMDIRYGRIDSSAQDMLIGFGGDDQLLFQGVAEATIDKDQSGALDWAWSGTLEAHHEGIAIDIDGVIVTSELDNDDSATLATLRALDVTVLTKRDLVILARDTAADSAILLHYSDSDGNGVINGGEVQVIATFFDGVPLMDEINVIGTYAE